MRLIKSSGLARMAHRTTNARRSGPFRRPENEHVILRRGQRQGEYARAMDGQFAAAERHSDGTTSKIRGSGGTSASVPIWAALIALADQYAGRHLGFVNPAIYQIARSPSYHQAFHDITLGNNTCSSRPRRSPASFPSP